MEEPLGEKNKSEKKTMKEYACMKKWNSITERFAESKAFVGELEVLAEIAAPQFQLPEYDKENPDPEGNYYGPTIGCQGGCFDGRYFYQTFLKYCYNKGEQYGRFHVNNAKNIMCIVKYDVLEGKVALVSKEMDFLNHGNDMTYHPKKNQIIICNNAGDKRRISFLNADTLEYEGSQLLDVELFGIDYHEATEQYVLGISGSYQFAIANNDFTEIRFGYGGVKESHNYTKQNLCCDDQYVYCLYSNSKNRAGADAIFVYDWNGKFITFIDINFEMQEPENLSVYNGALFVGAGDKGQVYFYHIFDLLKEN